jgi:hypothetical protein
MFPVTVSTPMPSPRVFVVLAAGISVWAPLASLISRTWPSVVA